MSEEPNTSKDHLQKNSSKDIQSPEKSMDEIGDKVKATMSAMKKKIQKPEKKLRTEYEREKFKEDTKDY